MKKLLTLLGAVSLTATATATVVACGSAPLKVSNDFSTEQLQLILKQFAKSAYISDSKKIDFNEFSKDMVNDRTPAQVDTDLVNHFDSEILEDSLKETLSISSKLKTNLKFEQEEININPMIRQILDIVPGILSELKDKGEIEGLIGMLSSPEMINVIKGFINPELILAITSVLDEPTLTLLKNAFDDSMYIGLTMQELLDSSIIGISNGLSKMLKTEDKYVEWLDFSNYNESVANLGNNIAKLINGEVTLELNVIDQLSGIIEIVRSIRLILVYLENVQKQTTASDIQDSNHLFSEQENNLDFITKIRQMKFEESNKQLDLKSVSTFILNGFRDEENGYGLRKIITALFISGKPKETSSLPFWIINSTNSRKGLIDILFNTGNYLVKLEPINIGIATIDIRIGNVFVDAMNIISTDGNISKLINTFKNFESSLPENFKGILKTLEELGDKDIFLELYSGNIIKEFMPESSIGNIKDILSKEINGYKISDILEKVLSELKEKDIKLNSEYIFKIFDKLSGKAPNDELFLSFVLNNLDDLFKNLGYEEGKIIKDSILDYVIELGIDLSDLGDVLGVVSTALTLDEPLNKFEKESLWKSIDVEFLKSEDNTYSYNVIEAGIKTQIDIRIEKNGKVNIVEINKK